MHIQVDHALVVIALVSSVVLLLQTSERTVALVCLFAAGLEALIVFGYLSMSISVVRIEHVLPAILAVAGALAWIRSSGKHAITAGTLVTVVGVVQLFTALHLISHG